MAAGVKYNWKGEKLTKELLAAISEGVARATEFLWAAARQQVNIGNTGVRVTRKRSTSRGAKGSSYTIYPNPSRPGESPHKITGWGQSHIEREHDRENAIGRVGIMAGGEYMLRHEFGIRTPRRPWLGMRGGALGNNLGQIRRLIAIGGKREITNG